MSTLVGAAAETRARHVAAAPDNQHDDPVHEGAHDKEKSATHWAEHFLYMVVVIDACGGADSLVLDNIVHQVSLELMDVMWAKFDPTRSDYMCLDEELARFAQLIDLDSFAFGREIVVAYVETNRQVTRACFTCYNTGNDDPNATHESCLTTNQATRAAAAIWCLRARRKGKGPSRKKEENKY